MRWLAVWFGCVLLAFHTHAVQHGLDLRPQPADGLASGQIVRAANTAARS